ncbi:MAG: pantoate--beta-alanine ligase [Candidatus Metalachnospira sp.]|nr:pantoate--beta-alanine ligase [Candidatus Metalachnospira sp.]
MIVVHKIDEVREFVKEQKKLGRTIGLVPTMGFLHEGHVSLVNKSTAENNKTVVSIFVNPTQFGPNEDFESYPRDLGRDCELLESAGVDLVFNPSPAEMYASDFTTYVNMTGVTEELCGKSRPVHFKGVCTVVTKLFNIVKPDNAYFGQKDAQQLAVIRRMVRDLNIDVNVVGCPIIREKDGLAKSSRNTYLSTEERSAAVVLSKAVSLGKKMISDGETSTLKIVSAMKNLIKEEPIARIDYVEAVDADSIEHADTTQGRRVLFAEAVFIGKTRLIDNFVAE